MYEPKTLKGDQESVSQESATSDQKKEISSFIKSKWTLDKDIDQPLDIFPKRRCLTVSKEESQKTLNDSDSVETHDNAVISHKNLFSKLGVPNWLNELASSLHINTPTEIQTLCLPPSFQGKNVIGCAPTGTGKTICFCWPILIALANEPFGIFGLVLTASRELATQIAEQFKLFGIPINASVCVCVGGTDIVQQGIELENRPHIVIGTPGRVADQITVAGKNIADAFSSVKYLVFDEADRILSTNFEKELKCIINCLPTTANGRITHLYSATITDAINALAKSISDTKFEIFDVTKDSGNVFLGLLLEHKYLYLPEHVHLAYIVYLFQTKLLTNERSQGIIFTGTRNRCQLIAQTLELLKFKATCVHSMMKQRTRNACLSKFRSGAARILVATDLISRGIDVPDVDFVINYDFPNTGNDYVHRVGRTARRKQEGIAISLVDPRDISRVKLVEEAIGIKLEKLDVDDTAASKLLNKVSTAMQKSLLFLKGINFKLPE
ncbi:bifunctional P-loop containing nucleoside triphosphate hydrolase/Helicase superfamily 1-2 [Babesia duncani]|uniref:Bifunctional P-loop containing nucleoside triphosphate hydrolase/Helicase superfamily 1-2 n=1 Tax=Babesia duncani TaxID=323732 RepID=A0AAD9PLD3_9APIC|nr:bifunctional P-loop containing nucleoside triphosphate hydrolase/Helicase superfamily 1-2 [Babesia duncani]